MEQNTMADINKYVAMKKITPWSSLTSPVGFVIFINGLATFAVLVRYFLLMG